MCSRVRARGSCHLADAPQESAPRSGRSRSFGTHGGCGKVLGQQEEGRALRRQNWQQPPRELFSPFPLQWPQSTDSPNQTASFCPGLKVQHPQAHVALCCPELILQGHCHSPQRPRERPSGLSPILSPISSPPAPIYNDRCHSEGGLFLLPAQVYIDISHGGVFEDGCLERNHVFPSIHDAVLFAQANAREVASGRDFQVVRSGHLGDPRPQDTEIAGPGGIRKSTGAVWCSKTNSESQFPYL